jgi:hypothetical protein
MDRKLGSKLMRCPRLGDEITLAYCLKESLDLPCAHIVRCWSSLFDIEALLKDELPPDLWQRFADHQPKDKVTNIIELIMAAKAKE